MLKLRKGSSIVNLIKAVKGAERPGHKYCKRIPLSGGGYQYFYIGADGKCGGEKRTYNSDEAKKLHPEHFDPLSYKFGVRDEEARNIINFRFSGSAKSMQAIKDSYLGSPSAALGLYKEAALLIGIEIGEGWVNDIDDAIYYLDNKYTSLANRTDKVAEETRTMIKRFMQHTRVLSEIETPKMNGKKAIEASWNQSGQTWVKTKSDLEFHSGRKVNAESFKFVPVSEQTGQDVIADYLLVHTVDGSTVDVFSLKWNSGRPISLKEGSYDTAVIGWLEKSGIAGLTSFAKELAGLHSEIKRDIRELKLDPKVGNNLRSARMKKAIFERLGLNLKPAQRTQMQLDFAASYAQMIIKKLHDVHNDPRSKDTVLNVSAAEKNGKVTLYQARASKLEKKIDDWLSSGIVVIKGETGGSFTAADGKNYRAYGNLNFTRVDPKTGEEVVFAIQEFRNSKNASQLRSPDTFFIRMMKSVENDNIEVSKLIEKYGAFRFKGSAIKSKTINLFKATQTLERKKMNAKYIRKELTESGKVRYIYRETQPRAKKTEEVSENRDRFAALVDSVDPAFGSLFNDSIAEIDDIHFNTINAGCSFVRITKDIDTFFDVLNVPQPLRKDERFISSSGLFNVSRGKMAFCISNFPEGIPDVVKKAVMMHEVGHAYFYGALRIKNKKPLDTFDSKDKDQKKFFKEAAKFVDGFGKIDKEIREKAEEKVTISEVKGQEKEALLLDTIKTYMVSECATSSSEEHFAEAFSRYFILPEQLKKKEKEVYDHFDAFFQKYGR